MSGYWDEYEYECWLVERLRSNVRTYAIKNVKESYEGFDECKYNKEKYLKRYQRFKKDIIERDPFYTYAKYNRRKLPRELLDLILN